MTTEQDAIALLREASERLWRSRDHAIFADLQGNARDFARKIDAFLSRASVESERKAAGQGDCVLVSRSFLEATPCPNCDGSGFFTSTGPDPEQEQCQWCFEKHMILSGAERAPAAPACPWEGPCIDPARCVKTGCAMENPAAHVPERDTADAARELEACAQDAEYAQASLLDHNIHCLEAKLLPARIRAVIAAMKKGK